MKSSIEIAQEAHLRPVAEIASSLELSEGDLEFYGKYKAKISLNAWRRVQDRPDGKMILITGINPTSAGEGKTTLAIGLGQASSHSTMRSIVCVREPSLGPVFGVKGGATGGGYAQIQPMEDVNLHFTGDLHAVTSAHNLLSALLDNHIHFGNELKIDPRRIVWKRVMDMNERSLRSIVVGLGGFPREDGFEITAASEVTAILALSTSISDLKEKLSKIIVAYTRYGEPVYAKDLKATGAMAMLLKDSLKPNLVQTLENTPAIVHGGPFANIAHGAPSIVGIRLSLKLADYVFVEAGFGADLGAEKFFNIVCRYGGFVPNAALIVVTLRALKMHGGAVKNRLEEGNIDALARGFENLVKHSENISKFGVPHIIALNRFEKDDEKELIYIKGKCESLAPTSISDVYLKGGKGGVEANTMLQEVIEQQRTNFRFLYDLDIPVQDKVGKVCGEIYGADGVDYTLQAEESIRRIGEIGLDGLPICLAKTQYSLSDDPKLLGRPAGFRITVRDVKPAAGAGFLVVYVGDILTMPGLPRNPSAQNMDIDEDGRITGLS